MNELRRPPYYMFKNVMQVAKERIRVLELPHDVLYDFKIIIQVEGESWYWFPIESVKRLVEGPWTQGVKFKTPRFEPPNTFETTCHGLINEYNECIDFINQTRLIHGRTCLSHSISINEDVKSFKRLL